MNSELNFTKFHIVIKNEYIKKCQLFKTLFKTNEDNYYLLLKKKITGNSLWKNDAKLLLAAMNK